MDFYKKDSSSESRREELIRKIEALCKSSAIELAQNGRDVAKGIQAAVSNLTLEELEALHYDMMTKRSALCDASHLKNYIND